jgi:excisionase family DNA binding protein
MDEKLLTVEEVADFFRTSKAQIYNIIHRGGDGIDIPPSFRVGRRRLWVKSTVMDWLDSQVKGGKGGENKVKASVKSPMINRI